MLASGEIYWDLIEKNEDKARWLAADVEESFYLADGKTILEQRYDPRGPDEYYTIECTIESGRYELIRSYIIPYSEVIPCSECEIISKYEDYDLQFYYTLLDQEKHPKVRHILLHEGDLWIKALTTPKYLCKRCREPYITMLHSVVNLAQIQKSIYETKRSIRNGNSNRGST